MAADATDIARMPLEEAVGEISARTFDHGKRTVDNVRQQPFRHVEVVTRNVQLRDTLAFSDDAAGIADRDAGDVGLRRGRGLRARRRALRAARGRYRLHRLLHVGGGLVFAQADK